MVSSVRATKVMTCDFRTLCCRLIALLALLGISPLQGSAADSVPAEPSSLPLAAPEPESAPRAAAVLRVRVVAAETGQPIADAVVVGSYTNEKREKGKRGGGMPVDVRFEPQKNGEHVAGLRADEQVTVLASAAKYLPEFEPVSLAAGDDQRITIKLSLAPDTPHFSQAKLHAYWKGFAKRYFKQLELYSTAMAKAKSEAEKIAVFNELSPEVVFIDELLDLEKRFRGTSAGLNALVFLAWNTDFSDDPKARVTLARERAGELLRTHYGDHPELDKSLMGWTFGVGSAAAEPLMRSALVSPHKEVRATAHYRLAEYLAGNAELAELHGATGITGSVEDRQFYGGLIQRIAAIGFTPENVAEKRQEARALLNEIAESYADVLERRWYFDPEEWQAIFVDATRVTPPLPTYGHLADVLAFALDKLGVGMQIPEIDAPDALGQPFKLSSLRGKITILTFSANWCSPCKSMYPNLRALVEKHDADRFAVVSVMGDYKIDTVRQALEDKEITWRVWWDGGEQQIISRWNVKSWPTVFVIDHRGIIRSHANRDDALNPLVQDLLDEQAAEEVER